MKKISAVVIFLTFCSLVVPISPAAAMELVPDKRYEHPMVTALKKASLQVGRPVYQSGFALTTMNEIEEEQLVTTKRSLQVVIPEQFELIAISSKVWPADTLDAQLHIRGEGEDFAYALVNTPAYVRDLAPGTYRLSLEASKYAEARLQLAYGEQAWPAGVFGVVLPDDHMDQLPDMLESAEDLIIIGNPEVSALFGVYHEQIVAEATETITAGEALQGTLRFDQSGAVEVLHEEVLSYAAIDPEVTTAVAGIVRFLPASDGTLRRIVVLSEDIFRQSASRQRDIAQSIQIRLAELETVVPSTGLNPAEATWLHTLITLLRNSLWAWMLLAAIIIILLAGPLVQRFKTHTIHWKDLIRPAGHWRGRLMQLVIFWLFFTCIVLILLAQRILALEQSGLFVRTLLARLRGFNLDGSEFCRKCVFIEDAPGLLIPVVFGFAASLIWLLWDRWVAFWQTVRMVYLDKIGTDQKKIFWHGLIIFIMLLVLIVLPFLGSILPVMLAGAMVLVLIYLMPEGCLPPVGPQVVHWFIYAFALIPLIFLVQLLTDRQVFSSAMETSAVLSTSRGDVPVVADTPVLIDALSPELIFSGSGTGGRFGSAQLRFNLTTDGAVRIISDKLFGKRPLVVDTALTDMKQQQEFGERTLYGRSERMISGEQRLEESILAGFTTGDEIALLVAEDQPWQREQDSYLHRSTFFTKDVSDYDAGEYRYELGLRGGPVTLYTFASQPFDLTISKQDYNKLAGPDQLVIQVENSEGGRVAFALIEDDGGLLGYVGPIQTATLSIPVENFVPGVHVIRLEYAADSAEYDYIIPTITLGTPYLMIEGPLGLEPDSAWYTRVDGRLTLQRIVESQPYYEAPCVGVSQGKSAGQDVCFSGKEVFHTAVCQGEVLVRTRGLQLETGEQYQLFWPDQQAYFEPFQYRFVSAVRAQTAGAIADSRLQVLQSEDRYEVMIENIFDEKQSVSAETILSLEPYPDSSGVMVLQNPVLAWRR